MNLFCFAYAGGSSNIFLKWKKYSDHLINVVPVEMPGRGARFTEEFCDNMTDLIDDLFNKIKSELINDSYMLYGHSMGSWIVYYLTCRIMKEGMRLPERIFISGKEAPHIIKNDIVVHKLNNYEFLKKINSLGGTPKEIMDNEEMLDIFIPIIKNDYKVIETCQFEQLLQSLECDITVFNGRKDQLTLQDLYGWRIYTKGNFKLHQFEGGHFFINDYAKAIMSIIKTQLEKDLVKKKCQSQIEIRRKVRV